MRPTTPNPLRATIARITRQRELSRAIARIMAAFPGTERVK